jgi:hypothetical protein
MILIAFLGLIVYMLFTMKIIEFVLNRTKTEKGALLALACGMLPLVIIIQLIVSFGLVE